MMKRLYKMIVEWATGRKTDWAGDYSCPVLYKTFSELARRRAARELKEIGYLGTFEHSIRKVVVKRGEIRKPYGWMAKTRPTGKCTPGECLPHKIIVVVGEKGDWTLQTQEMAVHLWKHAMLHFMGLRGSEAKEHAWMKTWPGEKLRETTVNKPSV